jgi:hypothetical protein
MENKEKQSCACGDGQPNNSAGPAPFEMLPIFNGPVEEADEPCCGPPAGPPSSVDEKPGYAIRNFVREFLSTPVGPVPVIKTRHDPMDRLGTLQVRVGIGRNDHKVAPGLYAAGKPDAQAPVLVTANYKLSFDHLRKHLAGLDAWLLVLDTRGINVWCAAGKGTFGTQEVIAQVLRTRLGKVVDHRKIILPQLGAPGVSALKVKKGCGFEVVWGPVRAEDVPAFLWAGQKAEERMRRVTFTMAERMVLAPVEISLARKPILWALLSIFVLSGIGRHFFSFATAWERSLIASTGCVAGILAGCIIVPLLLPWIPGRAFAMKGLLAGLAAGIVITTTWSSSAYISFGAGLALILLTTTVSSFLAMNFTGTTPFTSPSGVEKEMRKAIPLQIGAVVLAAGLWVGAAF